MKRVDADKYRTFRTYLNDVEIKKEGIFGGYEVGRFRPDESVTREQVAKVLAFLYKKLKNCCAD